MRSLVLPFSLFFLFMGVNAMAADLPRRDGANNESYPGLQVEYGQLDVGDGIRLRTILTKPQNSERPPVILFVQWLSCDSVEVRSDRTDGWSQMIRGVVRDSGWAVMRTDKRGIGDSEGGPCSELDYNTELADHRAALQALSERDDVANDRIVVFGASMGSRMAGQVAAGVNGVIGVSGWGGGSKTWFERMQAFDRNAMELGGVDANEMASRMNQQTDFRVQYLLEGMDPPDIIAADPDMAGVWDNIVGTSADAHYGRVFAFHQQAQKADFTAAWGQISVPVLMTMGEYDWFENQAGHETVVRVVNRNQPDLARFELIPRMDHHFTLFDSAGAAFRDEAGQPDAGPFLMVFLSWLNGL